MDDLINRQQAIDAIAELMTRYIDRRVILAKAQDAVNNVPSVQPEQRWIPVSEKLPKEGVMVLVTDDTGGMATVETDWCGRYENTGERFWFCSQNVTAWMPLPKTYQKEGGK